MKVRVVPSTRSTLRFAGKTTGEPKGESHQDNLFEPARGHYGAHGGFDDRAIARSFQLWASKHRVLLTGVLAAAGAVAVLLRSRR